MNDSRTPESPAPELDSDAIDAQASPEELTSAQALREALSAWPRQAQCQRRCPPLAQANLELALAVRHAARPEPIDSDRHDRILDRALLLTAPKRSRRPKPLGVVFGAASALAMAAALALVVMRLGSQGSAVTASEPEGASDSLHLVPCRSAAHLFDARFPVAGGTTDRIDRIALARERDLRSNLFDQWRAP